MKEFATCLQQFTYPGDAMFTRTDSYDCFSGCILLGLMFADGRKGTMKAEVQEGLQTGGVGRGLGSMST